tara:strand:- start:607 stop:2418 length:1812 start_codon:yes stop_codon:yes gene_type:complete
MQVTIFDIETNAIKNFMTLEGLEKIHCIAVMDRGDDEPRLLPIEEALEHMRKADILCGHNAHAFDIPAIKKLYPEWNYEGCLRDTLLLSRLGWPDIRNEDFKREGFQNNLIGRHSLKAWGVRIGLLKGDFSENTNWESYTDEMGEYCKQDVRVTHALYKMIEEKNLSEESVMLEHSFADIIRQQERNGIGFDVTQAKDLYTKLVAEKIDIESNMHKVFPPTVIEMKKPQYYLDTSTGDQYTTKGEAPYAVKKFLEPGPLRTKTIPFNPGSRMDIANVFIKKYGWKPKEFTNEGRPRIDESILTSLPYEEAEHLLKYLLIQKRLGQLSDGNEAWIKHERNGRIHGTVNTNSCVSSRCSHQRPNLAQVPAVGSPWGKECRSLFIPGDNKVMLGVDASGLELRCLASYCYPFDNGAYVKSILEGDIHTTNQEAAGLETRSQAKRMIYCLIYGGGDAKLGEVIDGGRKEGKEIRDRFFRKIPALKQLTEAVKNTARRKKSIKALDGRYLPVRSEHSALNLLLQSCGAILMKKSTELMHRAFANHDLTHRIKQVAHIHDEVQFEVEKGYADEAGKLCVEAIQKSRNGFRFYSDLDGEYRTGTSWAATH